MSKVAVVFGVGPGISRSVAIKFAKEGFSVGLMARRKENMEAVASEIKNTGGTALSVVADGTDVNSIVAAFKEVRDKLGDPEVLVYNAGAFKRGSIVDIVPSDFEQTWKSGCMGALIASQQVLPQMAKKGSGTLIFTGATASLRGGANFSPFAVAKFGLRALAQSIAREFQPQGIHVSHVIIDGVVDTAHTGDPKLMSPDAIAETYWQLHKQHKSAWTLELELRPHVEKF